ncbi:ThiF family adenylyltransferase [Vibrio profundi]|uniref:ThiF family adenylyltransferase n=1 Tax=Vibrio profundi TaxID=1774960 RepID=UPI003736A5B4
MRDKQADIENEFLAWGFSYKPIQSSYPPITAFEKSYSTKVGDFLIYIPIEDPSLLRLPKPLVKKIPECLSNVRLPHLEGNRTICLFDEATKNVDPLTPRAVISACLDQLEKIIDGWANGSNLGDIAVEFASYWESERTCFLLSDAITPRLFCYDRSPISLESLYTEYVIASNSHEANEWSMKRNSTLEESALPKELCKVLSVKVNCLFFIPFDQSWPPRSLGDIIEWLGKVDSRSTSSLLDKLRNEAKESSTFMVLLTSGSISVAIRFTLTQLGKAALGVSLPKKKKRHYKLHISALKKNHCVTSFQRFRVDNATQEYFYTRNNSSPSNLKDKRVCVIGCGTIGGYLTQGLVQFGAGSGRGMIALYDDDILKTGNLGRHILGIQYLNENKSESLAHFMRQHSLTSEIYSYKTFTKKDVDLGWDLIVDATGNQSFSILLAKWYRETIARKTSPSTTLIHSWISGFGHQAKSFIDHGQGACFACLFEYKNNPRKDRYPSFKDKNTPDVSNTFKRTCGESHLPFGPEASMVATSLALRLIKQEKSKQLNFLQKNLSELAINYSEKKVDPMRSCPICQ